jgi:hypothetical protein
VVPAAPPPGSRLKGDQDILLRALRLSAEVVRYRRERWLTPAGETVLAPLPAWIGVELSKRQVGRLLTSRRDDLTAGNRAVRRAGLATARSLPVSARGFAPATRAAPCIRRP